MQKARLFGRDADRSTRSVRCPGRACSRPISAREIYSVDLHHELPLGYPGCNRLERLRLAHHDCNRTLGPAKLPPEGIQRESESENISRGIGLESPSPGEKPYVVQQNEEGEPAFREFVVEQLLRYGGNPKSDFLQFLRPGEILLAGSEWSGMNPKTCYPYLGRMTNKINGFLVVKLQPSSRKKYLAFRYPGYYDMEAKDILDLHPKEGLRSRQDQLASTKVL